MFLKKLFYASAAILMLVAAYHLGASPAGAQAPGNPIVAGANGWSSFYATVITANGDVYGAYSPVGPWTHLSNVFTGPTPAASTTFGALKARYR